LKQPFPPPKATKATVKRSKFVSFVALSAGPRRKYKPVRCVQIDLAEFMRELDHNPTK
jgi:hypothetical protein